MKRFYETVSVLAEGEGFSIRLDGRPVKTPHGLPLKVPQQALAEAIAAEWRDQDTDIVPHTMPLTQLATTVADRVRRERDAIIRNTAAYIESDLVCYRAEEPDYLVLAQSEQFDSALEWFEERTGLSLAVVRGVLPVAQPPQALEIAIAQLVDKSDEAVAVAHLAVSLTASFVLGLRFAEGIATAAELFEAGFIDELYQQEKWGRDTEATARLEAIRQELEVLDTYRDLTANFL
jgi:chaperone required for assembly of F1-ATPase